MPSQPEDIIDDHGIAYSSWHQLLLGGSGDRNRFGVDCSIQLVLHGPEKSGHAMHARTWPRYPTKQPFMAAGPAKGRLSTGLPHVRSDRMCDVCPEERR